MLRGRVLNMLCQVVKHNLKLTYLFIYINISFGLKACFEYHVIILFTLNIVKGWFKYFCILDNFLLIKRTFWETNFVIDPFGIG